MNFYFKLVTQKGDFIIKFFIVLTLFSASPYTFAKNKIPAIKSKVFDIAVTQEGFQPKTIEAKPGIPVILNITRKTDDTCATEVQIPSMKIRKALPLNTIVSIKLGKLKKGEVHFGCGMNMMEAAVIQVK